MPIAQHYGESPSEIIRLYEVVKGALLVLQQSIKRVALDRRVSYDFIKKFFKMEEMVVKRITEVRRARGIAAREAVYKLCLTPRRKARRCTWKC